VILKHTHLETSGKILLKVQSLLKTSMAC